MNKLLVEGKLDAVLLDRVLDGRPVIAQGGSKNALKPKAVEERRRAGNVCYVRDRDFDLDPPADRSRPAIHSRGADDAVLGWHWCRHEMENYLLEPGIVARATARDETQYRAALLESARRVLDYQAARGAIGAVRRLVPPNYDLHTRPDGLPDDACRLPDDLSLEATSAWACAEATRFHDRLCPQLMPPVTQGCITERRALLSSLVHLVDEVLVWFAGKDLMAGLMPWLTAEKLGNPGSFRATLRDWMSEHPEEALVLLPEWRAFVEVLRQ